MPAPGGVRREDWWDAEGRGEFSVARFPESADVPYRAWWRASGTFVHGPGEWIEVELAPPLLEIVARLIAWKDAAKIDALEPDEVVERREGGGKDV